jgi:opacity protein-like surface antigen
MQIGAPGMRPQHGLLTMIGNTLFAMSVTADSLRMRAMRLVILCALVFGFANGAAGRDFSVLGEPVLRGSGADQPSRPTYMPGSPLQFRWEGLYIGGHVGRTMGGFDYGNGVVSLLEYILRQDVVLNHVRDWTTLDKENASATSYGGFIGYNTRWEDAVVGLELNYNRTNVRSSAADSLTRIFQDDAVAPGNHHFFYSTTVSGSASAKVTDYGTLRARFGWATGQFLPYGFAALAVGRADVVRSATVRYTRTDIPDILDPPITPQPVFNFGPTTKSEISNGVFAVGYSAGAGIDIALLPNVFVRGEWEWIQFSAFKDVNVSFNTVRAAAGVKF